MNEPTPTHGVCDVCARVIRLRMRLRTGKPITPYKLVAHKTSDGTGKPWCDGTSEVKRVVRIAGYANG